MRNFPILKQLTVVIILFFGISSTAQGKTVRKHKPRISENLNEAMKRSNTDQQRIKIRFDDEATDRIDSWKYRQLDMIEIKHTGTSSVEPVDLGKPDYSYEESGVDQSGLDRWHGDVEEESIDINFDKELRDVSSFRE